MQQYLDLMRHVRDHGIAKTDRTGTGTRSVFGYQMRFDLADGFPLVTTKKLHTKSIIHELLWFLKGDTNIDYLQRERRLDLGRMGRRVRRSRPRLWPPVAGLASRRWFGDRPDLRGIETIKTNPDSRRMVVSAWNPADIPDMALAPCHCLFQFYVAERPPLLPALSALCRYLPGCAVQHCQLCPVHPDGRPRHAPGARRFRAHLR